MLVVEEHLAAERAADGKVEALGETLDAGDRRLAPARAAEDDEGSLGRPQQFLELRHLSETGMGLSRGEGPRVGNRRGLAEHVLG